MMSDSTKAEISHFERLPVQVAWSIVNNQPKAKTTCSPGMANAEGLEPSPRRHRNLSGFVNTSIIQGMTMTEAAPEKDEDRKLKRVLSAQDFESNSSKKSTDTVSTTASLSDEPGKQRANWRAEERVKPLVGDDEWAPLLIRALFRPPTTFGDGDDDDALDDARREEKKAAKDEYIKNCKKILRGLVPPEVQRGAPRQN
eukprot:gnl/TRDRNA2_/TRDRNA2_91992_c0_seq1.p2 gnl/TRDRNA2_/TRDRNA2_91992_c0~~gnl/TRDRNA2_/TRDRNA2_91992_c0_seq1.p2  ORF type:complete len:199 (+),score=41.47 gnl/TRDRNA2_/TRDRNA2_91992_c0_seq1:133-729(+)